MKKTRERPNGTIRSKVGLEQQTCSRCGESKDIICFQSYWYQPTRDKKPYGEKVRRRMTCCNDCRRQR